MPSRRLLFLGAFSVTVVYIFKSRSFVWESGRHQGFRQGYRLVKGFRFVYQNGDMWLNILLFRPTIPASGETPPTFSVLESAGSTTYLEISSVAGHHKASHMGVIQWYVSRAGFSSKIAQRIVVHVRKTLAPLYKSVINLLLLVSWQGYRSMQGQCSPDSRLLCLHDGREGPFHPCP